VNSWIISRTAGESRKATRRQGERKMKFKVSELDGHMLDAAVAKADKTPIWDLSQDGVRVGNYGCTYSVRFSPSTEWSDGGEIIERERMLVWPTIIRFDAEGIDPLETPIKQWAAMHPNSMRRDGGLRGVFFEGGTVDVEATSGMPGPTPLIAAMRAYVEATFGETVELP
jgi:hypothetical protein